MSKKRKKTGSVITFGTSRFSEVFSPGNSIQNPPSRDILREARETADLFDKVITGLIRKRLKPEVFGVPQ